MQPSLLFSLSCLLAGVAAVPVQNEALSADGTLIVVDPKITYPTADTVWVVGQKYNVTWDNSDLPALVNITNVEGTVVLGQFDGDGERLYLQNPLAKGFFITDPSVEITVPVVPPGDYMIVLMGDSGNQSPQFKIVADSSSSSSSASASSSTIPVSGPASPATSSSTEAPTITPSTTSTVPVGASLTADNAAQHSGTQTPVPTSNSASSWFGNNLLPVSLASAMITLAMAL